MRQFLRKGLRVILIGVTLLCAVLFFLHFMSGETITTLSETHRYIAALLFGVLMCVTTVIAPLTSLPLVPMLAPVLGPFTTGVAAYSGWVIGACIIFYIGRTYGREYVTRIISEKTLSKYESLVRPEMGFVLLVALHMVFPVDIISYLLALGTRISFRVYLASTMIGVAWGSFAFAYLGSTFIQHDYVRMVQIGVVSCFILVCAWLYAKWAIHRGENHKN